MARREHRIDLRAITHASFVDNVLDESDVLTRNRDESYTIPNKLMNERLETAMDA